MQCERCQGECWDESRGKYWNNGKTADGKNKPRWRCKNKSGCGWAGYDSPATTQAAPAPVAPQPAPQAPAEGYTANGSKLYGQITNHVLKEIVPRYVQSGIPITMEGTAAIIATLYISAQRQH